nr:DUF4468 domain-containing protein [uncultured Arsenicibacter sp.]
MKNLFTCLLLITVLSSCAPELYYYTPKVVNGKLEGVLPVKDGKVYYEFSDKIDSAKAEMIFRQARRWGALHLENPNSIFGMSDNKLYDIIGSGSTNSYFITKEEQKSYRAMPFRTEIADYSVIIECNDSKMRVSFGNFKLQKGNIERPTTLAKYQYVKTLEKVENDIFEIYDSLVKLVKEGLN